MNRRNTFIIFLLILFFSINSCKKRTYDVLVDGFVYEDCIMRPMKNLSIYLINGRRGSHNFVNTKTDSNGHFSINLKGEGPSSINLEIDGISSTTIQSCQVYVYKRDSAELYLNKGAMNISDTLYVSFYNYYFFDEYNPIQDSMIYKFTENNFNPYSHIKMRRNDLMQKYYSTWDQVNELWVKNSLEVYMVWGNGLEDFKNSV